MVHSAFNGDKHMIYVKTESGQSALLNRSLVLTPRQRSAFIMFDGKRSKNDVLKATQGLGITEQDVNYFAAQGLLVLVPETAPVPSASPARAATASAAVAVPVAASIERPTQDAQAHYSKAYPIATRLTAALGLRGFLLNLAVEAATDLAKLQELSPRIKQAVGPGKFRELEIALFE